ncbi:MAG: hypothetical protein H8F28_01320 [Fibrella sp.]|nr:hypothetical protein [Armatimonadota bacterium]
MKNKAFSPPRMIEPLVSILTVVSTLAAAHAYFFGWIENLTPGQLGLFNLVRILVFGAWIAVQISRIGKI